MPATRTQIYLSEEQRRKIDAVAASEGVTMAEIVRRALDSYLSNETDVEAALAGSFGADPDASPPSRDEWDRG
jgi:predicted DNA-binding protein